MNIIVVINTDDESVEILIQKSWAKSPVILELLDKLLAKKIRELLPKLAEKIRRISE